MLKQDITYIDFEGVENTETFYFNLTKADIVEWELENMSIVNGETMEGSGFVERVQAVAKNGTGKQIMAVFKDLILRSYGRRSEDGKRFFKTEEATQDFSGSPAYSVLFVDMVTNAEKAAAFLNGVVPADLADKMAQQAAANEVRPDGRPALKDHLPKQAAATKPVEELRTVSPYTDADFVAEDGSPINLAEFQVKFPRATEAEFRAASPEVHTRALARREELEAQNPGRPGTGTGVSDPATDEGYQAYLRSIENAVSNQQ